MIPKVGQVYNCNMCNNKCAFSIIRIRNNKLFYKYLSYVKREKCCRAFDDIYDFCEHLHNGYFILNTIETLKEYKKK